MHITLSEEERGLLHRLLEAHRVGLSHEIHKTDTREFRQRLLAEEELTRGLLAKLGAAPGR